MLPFTRERSLGVFAEDNTGVWPGQILAYLLGLAVVVALLRPTPLEAQIRGRRAGSHVDLDRRGPPRARLRADQPGGGGLWCAVRGAGVLFLMAGVAQRRLVFGRSTGLTPVLGWVLVAYAAVLFPRLGQLTRHVYPAQPTVGITPCPVTPFSFGVLLFTVAPVPRWLLVIPLAWPLRFCGLTLGPLILRDSRRAAAHVHMS